MTIGSEVVIVDGKRLEIDSVKISLDFSKEEECKKEIIRALEDFLGLYKGINVVVPIKVRQKGIPRNLDPTLRRNLKEVKRKLLLPLELIESYISSKNYVLSCPIRVFTAIEYYYGPIRPELPLFLEIKEDGYPEVYYVKVFDEVIIPVIRFRIENLGNPLQNLIYKSAFSYYLYGDIVGGVKREIKAGFPTRFSLKDFKKCAKILIEGYA